MHHNFDTMTEMNISSIIICQYFLGSAPQPIIIERSQTLNELQKLHEQQQSQQKGVIQYHWHKSNCPSLPGFIGKFRRRSGTL